MAPSEGLRGSPHDPHRGGPAIEQALQSFWSTYYRALKRVHEENGRQLTEPVRDRNLSTTDARHVKALEEYCCQGLAAAIGVDPGDVGSRKIRFRPYRSKSFDVCWPKKGDPKILISVKSMQNAYRNFTNRIEEALGDAAVLRVYGLPACFGFWFFILDGPVARGHCKQLPPPERLDPQGRPKRTKGASINLALVEQGGDFFSLPAAPPYHRLRRDFEAEPKRQDVIAAAQQTMTDLLAPEPSEVSSIHYDAIALLPATIQRVATTDDPTSWGVDVSPVDPPLRNDQFFHRLLETARLRRFL